MANKRSFEMAAAYVSVMPSLEGIEGELSAQISKAIPGMDRVINQGLSKSFSNASAGASKSLFSGILSEVNKVGDSIFSGIGGAFQRAGSLFSSTIATGVKAATATVGAGLTAVIGQVATGGFNRALGLNEAQASLDALGYTATQVKGVMSAVDNAITGTSATMDQAMGTATQLLSAGVTDYGDLEQTLKNVSKLSDISGTSFADMGTIFAKNAASGKVQYADLVQLMNHQIPIMSELAKSMGKPADEIRAMASAGEITFKDFQDAVEKIDFDSATYAAKNTALAFSNVRAGLSRVGQKFWQPLIDGAGPAFNVINQGIKDLEKNPAYKKFADGIIGKLEDRMGILNEKVAGFGSKIADKSSFSETIEAWIKKIDKFKANIAGMEGMMGGLGFALASGLLSQLPIVGGLFGGITVGVGLLGGALVQAYSASERLQGAFSSLGETFKASFGNLDLSGILDPKFLGDSLGSIVEAINNLFSRIDIDISGLSLNPLISFFTKQIKAFIDVIAANGPEISAAINGTIGAIKDVFIELGTIKTDVMKDIAGNVVEVIKLLPSVLSLVGEVSSGFISAFATVAGSDITKSIIGVIANALQWIQDNDLGSKVGIAIAAIYGINKIMGPLKGLGKLLPLITGAFSGAPAVAKAVGGGIGSIISAVATAGQAAIKGAVGILAIEAFILSIGGVIWLLQQMDTFEILRDIALSVVEVVSASISSMVEIVGQIGQTIASIIEAIGIALGNAWPSIEPILTFINESFSGFFYGLSDLFTSGVTVISDAVNSFIEVMSGSFSLVLESIEALLITLSENGITAGAGAGAAALGITELAGALVALTAGGVLQSLGDFASGAIDGLGALFGFGGGSLDGLVESAQVLTNFSSQIEGMPALWETVGSMAYDSGARIMNSFGQGMIAGLASAEAIVIAQVSAMMSRIQSTVSSTPVNLNVSASGAGSSGNTYNTNNSYSIRTSNDSVARSLINAARGARRY